ncbi:MAG: tetratricopeptide repeat protein [Gammaproteobacteria bacterium]|nr:tetratricopeptide repeat protein [Gammaproteobacteria bacterium]MDH4311282.1 tetratricopeptide repeat protein [Gammaproteobacteria bacterium]
MPFLTELKRRNVFKVAGAYLALGWVVVQATATLAPALNLPESALPLVTWIGVIGFPFVVVFSWAYELTPEGLKRERDVDRSQSITHLTSKRLDYIIIVLLVVAMLMFAADRFIPRDSGVESVADSANDAPPQYARTPATDQKSIAVLPFESLSSDAENEHFADGLHDELLTKLAKLHDLKVISRTSVMEYKDKARNLREIGTALGVATILEGTVRKADNRVRLSMQLIDTDTDAHLWAETYERELTDVFQIQTAVADEIAQALKLNFSAEERSAVDQQASANAEAYDLYLRARRYGDYFALENEDLRKARELLERAVALDPGFAEAHGRLAVVTAVQYNRNDHSAERLAQSERAIARALGLDPQLPSAYFAKAHNEYWVHQRFEVALADLDRALAREPNYAEALTMRGWLYRRLGRWDEMLAAFMRAVELNPRHPDVLQSAGQAAAWLRRYAEAARYYDRAVAAAPDNLDYAAQRAYYEINWHGDLALLREVVRRTEATDLRTRRQWAWSLAQLEGRFDELDPIVAQWAPEMFEGGNGLKIPKSAFVAFNAWLRSDRGRARSAAAEARRDLERQLAGRKDADRFASFGALLAALVGDAPAARRLLDVEERYARSINDAVLLKSASNTRMTVMLMLGERGEALDELEQALADPVGGGEVADAAQVAIDPVWKELRDDPRFKDVIAKHRPKD